ncbi:MAG: thiamine phosphate synthase [Deltaproteobacteria bacterium]|nr:MAG: thiamine phosphate synthase [Deltaproteobacteria bacterium]
MLQGLYAIIDEGVLIGEDLVRVAQDYLEGGIKIIQYRHKHRHESTQSYQKYLQRAEAIGALRSQYAFTYIINDDLDAFQKVGADGIHVGKDDFSIEECRKQVGSKIIGYSSHSLAEALEAEKRGPDYVAFGAIFPTTTKGPGHPIQSVEKLKVVVESLKVPVVAIGGIGRDNVQDVVETGVAMVAMISALGRPQSKNRVTEARYFVDIINKR